MNSIFGFVDLTGFSVQDERPAKTKQQKIKELEADLMKLEAQRTKMDKIQNKVKKLKSSLHSYIETYFSTLDYVPIELTSRFDKESSIETHDTGVRAWLEDVFDDNITSAKSIAKSLSLDAEKKLTTIANAASGHLQSELNHASQDIFDNLQEETQPIISELERKLKKSFDLKDYITPPSIYVTSSSFNTTVSFTVRERVVDYWLHKSRHSVVKKQDIINEYRAKIRSLNRQFEEEIERIVEEELVIVVDKYFDEIDSYINLYRGFFKSAMSNNALDFEAKKNLSEKVEKLLPICENLISKVNELGADVKSVIMD